MPLVARSIILKLFEKSPQWRRKELADAVEREHLRQGGSRGVQSSQMVVKKALQRLGEDGTLINVGFGLWRTSDGESPDSADANEVEIASESCAEESEKLVVEEEIGEGSETIYLYYNPNDRRLAQLESRDTWECKVGRSSSDAADRIAAQGAKTALSHTPVIGLKIKCADSSSVEKALHASLRLADREVIDAPGVEWFYTSPVRVKDWFAAYKISVARLEDTLM